MELAPGVRLPEHDHGACEIVLIPLSGSLELRHGQDRHGLGPGSAAHVGVGERVSLANPGPEPASVMVMASPPQFAARMAAWPAL